MFPVRGLLVLVVLVGLLPSLGCVQRRLTIRSYPDGAMVYVDDQELGRTPYSTPFTHYGIRSIRLEKDGYETIEVDQRLPAPWYLTPPLDFVVENFWPFEIRDEREVEFELQPAQLVPQSELIERGERTRLQVEQGLVMPSSDEPRGHRIFHRNRSQQ